MALPIVISVNGTDERRRHREATVAHTDGVVDSSIVVQQAIIGEVHPIDAPVKRNPCVIRGETEPSLVQDNVRPQGHVVRSHMNPVGSD